MFKKGDVIIYPSHGKGRIRRICKEKNETVYYELVYADNLELLVPTEKAELLGMRYPLTKNSILKILHSLNKITISEEDLQNIEKVTRELFSTGKFEDTVYLIKLLKRLKKNKSKLNKKLELSQRTYLSQAMALFRSEVCYVLGDEQDKKYNL